MFLRFILSAMYFKKRSQVDDAADIVLRSGDSVASLSNVVS
jgi:hypothetical protein